MQQPSQTGFRTYETAITGAWESNQFTYVPAGSGKARSWLRLHTSPLGRLALFVVYFWFGVLKLFGVSPAGPLVTALWLKTIPFIPLEKFMLLFACYEMLIGILFLVPRLERLAIASLLVHVCTTCMPLVLLPHIVWQMFMVPSLEGQYIIKNIVVVALALSIGAGLKAGRQDRQLSGRVRKHSAKYAGTMGCPDEMYLVS